MEQILKLKPNISDATKRTYQQTFKRAETYFKCPLYEVTSQQVCNAVDNMIRKGDNINSVKAVLNICILFYQATEKDASLMIEKRNGLNGVLNEHVKQRKQEKAQTLVTYETLINGMNYEYDAGNIRNYIVQYLFLHYAFRNKDINLKIMPTTRHATDLTINYMVTNIYIKGCWCIKLIISNYKTASTYGQKEIIITDQVFVKATRAFVRGKAWLLTDKETPLQDISLATRIQAFTYQRNTESNYFKSIINWCNQQNNTTYWLKWYSKHRGTDVATILNSYDMDNESI